MHAPRAPWTDHEAEVVIVAPESAVKRHPNYPGAKTGDLADAWTLVDSLLCQMRRGELDALLAGRPILASVQAFEGMSVNRIPIAMAQWLAGDHDVRVDVSLVQINRVGHTGSSGWDRLARQALFAGEVVAGGRYVLVDDFIGQGGTLANLRGHIMGRGGLVAGFLALTGQPRSAKIALSPHTLFELRSKHEDVEDWWSDRFGFAFDRLTESEGRYLLRVDAHTIRSRLSQAGQGAVR